MNRCKLCKQPIRIKTEDDGTTQGEYDVEVGHLKDCELFEE